MFGAVANSDDFIAALSPGAGPIANGTLANGVSKPERTVTVKAEPYDYKLPAHKAALIMIDFQKDFMLPGGFGDALGNKIELLKVRRLPHSPILGLKLQPAPIWVQCNLALPP